MSLAFKRIWKFQSTHPRRVWLVWIPFQQETLCFNPHTHAGCDTPASPLVCWRSNGFQSTHPRRVWPKWQHYIQHYFQFQSTHPRRVWLFDTDFMFGIGSFNPHTHAGCDLYAPFGSPSKDVSIHTPTQGVTNSYICGIRHCRFQSTHPRRVWLGVCL